MSLTSIIDAPETKAFLKNRIIVPKGLAVPAVLVPRKTARAALMGAAFDYALKHIPSAKVPYAKDSLLAVPAQTDNSVGEVKSTEK